MPRYSSPAACATSICTYVVDRIIEYHRLHQRRFLLLLLVREPGTSIQYPARRAKNLVGTNLVGFLVLCFLYLNYPSSWKLPTVRANTAHNNNLVPRIRDYKWHLGQFLPQPSNRKFLKFRGLGRVGVIFTCQLGNRPQETQPNWLTPNSSQIP